MMSSDNQNGHLFANRQTLVLSMAEIKSLLTMTDCIELQRVAFADHARGTAFNAPSSWLRVDKHSGWLKLLAGFVDSTDALGVKTLARYPKNPPGMNLGSLIILFDPHNGFPLAIFDAVYITALRTGAGAGIATQYCARPDSRTIGVLGSGVLARFSVQAIQCVMPSVERVVFYSRNAARRTAYMQKMQPLTGLPIEPLDTPEAVVQQADILVTATNASGPVLFAEDVRAGTHINAMGIKHEIHPSVFPGTHVYGDSREVAIDDGKFGIALQAGAVGADDIAGEIGEVINGDKPGRTSPEEITIFDSAGLAVQDVVCALHVYQQAQQQQIGTTIDLGLAEQP